MFDPISAFRLDGKTALVTGGGTGLGLAMASTLSAAGARVVITGRREAPLLEAVAALGPSATHVCGDVSCPDDRQRMLRTALDHGGTLDILINNAGQNMKKPALEVSDAEFDALLEIHLRAAFALSRDAAASMTTAGSGCILFIASMASFLAIPGIVGYTTAKTGVLGLTRSLAAEWSPLGIRVNAIAPGWIETPMTRAAFDGDPERKRKVLSRTPAQRMGSPADIGLAALYLCSPAAAFVTGQVLAVDGGASVGF